VTTVIQPQVDGPLKVTGEVEILNADGSVNQATAQTWLCRCGKSANKPFCDGSHRTNGFRDGAQVWSGYASKVAEPVAESTKLRITPRSKGPLHCTGAMSVQDRAGREAWKGNQASLCRCGASKNKPFCDGSHRQAGFEAA
jgi:CDGSH-type Zn-finger protein